MLDDSFIFAAKKISPPAAQSLKPLPLLIATHNEGKRAEWAKLLIDLPVKLHTLRQYPDCPVAPEDGATFEANALMKARFYYQHCQMLVLADDSGLEVEALNYAPGVYSARYGEPHFTDAERAQLILSQLALKDSAKACVSRAAHFVCVVALVGHLASADAPVNYGAPSPPPHIEQIFAGNCRGIISRKARGAQGFGYDPIFIPENYEQTFGELSPQIKNRISHRARAASAATQYLKSLIG